MQTVLTPAGLENVQGVLTTQFTKQARDPAWAQDPEVIECIPEKMGTERHPNDFIGSTGYVNAQAIARALDRCGDDLTRDNLLQQATNFKKERVAMLLPGVELNNSRADYAPYRSLRMARFEKCVVEASGLNRYERASGAPPKHQPITRARRNSLIASDDRPISLKTSSVCCPSIGGGNPA